MQINDLEEYNCLLSEGTKLGLSGEHWTDGNDVDDAGIWTHAYDGSAVSFFAPKLGCRDDVRHGGDALLLDIGGARKSRGNYCDYFSNNAGFHFICEGNI